MILDGGDSFYRDDVARAEALAPRGIDYLDVGTSGGVFGFERGYCMMIVGEPGAVEYLDPIFRSLAPGAPPHTRATCTAGLTVRATSSRWSTTASNTA